MYLSRGGKILVTGYGGSLFLPVGKNAVLEELPDAVWKEYQPELLSPLTRAGSIRMSPSAHWGAASSGQLVHYAQDGKGIVVSYHVGKGEVIWWADATPLTNKGIKEAGNLYLLLYSLGGSRDVHILWDEYFHSYRSGGGSFVSALLVWCGLGLSGLVVLSVIVTFRRGIRPNRQQVHTSRSSDKQHMRTLRRLWSKSKETVTI